MTAPKRGADERWIQSTIRKRFPALDGATIRLMIADWHVESFCGRRPFPKNVADVKARAGEEVHKAQERWREASEQMNEEAKARLRRTAATVDRAKALLKEATG